MSFCYKKRHLEIVKDTINLKIGGVEGDRTLDLLHAMQALSQLSYNPKFSCNYNI